MRNGALCLAILTLSYVGVQRDIADAGIRSGSIHGTKWLDANGNAARDASEPGLPGVTI